MRGTRPYDPLSMASSAHRRVVVERASLPRRSMGASVGAELFQRAAFMLVSTHGGLLLMARRGGDSGAPIEVESFADPPAYQDF